MFIGFGIAWDGNDALVSEFLALSMTEPSRGSPSDDEAAVCKLLQSNWSLHLTSRLRALSGGT